MGFALRMNKGASTKPKTVEVHNPYLVARREWDERYGDFITRARNWRTIALISTLVSLVSTAGMLWQVAASRVIPFVVLVDSLGRPVASGLAEKASVGDDRLRRAVIQDWIENVRMVTTDGIAQRRAIDHVYAYIASGTNAQAFISDFYRNDPPFKRAQTGTVSVEVKSVLPTSDRTFEVDWIIHDCAQCSHGRAAGASQPTRPLRDSGQLGKGSVIQIERRTTCIDDS